MISEFPSDNIHNTKRYLMKNATFFESYTLNEDITLQNKIAMAPLTRCFANEALIPTEDMMHYYAKRGDAGLIISEATLISKYAQGYPNQPGIFTQEHIEGWKKITQAVHNNGAKIASQLFHAGRLTHSTFHHSQVVAPSSVIFDEPMPRSDLRYETPRALTIDEIHEIKKDFVQAALNAREAGFDLVELHCANGYLADQFLHQQTNTREDQYGGNAQNRSRFVLELIDEVIQAVGKNRVGIRISPHAYMQMEHTTGDEETFKYLLSQLEKKDIAYVHTGIFDDNEKVDYLQGKVSEFIRHHYQGNLIGNGSYDLKKGQNSIENKEFDVLALGRFFIANPDLISRIKKNKTLVEYDNNMLEELI
jgi:2,4-dienoyl-CoA reductase-like NADH-dependent reductase (Old Yellow Enzyme family)